jgi:hypothetical protein
MGFRESSATTAAGRAGLGHADVRSEAISLLTGEEEDAFGTFDDGADHREKRQEREIAFDLHGNVRRSDQGGAAFQDLKRLGAADAMVGVVRRPKLKAGGDVGADGAAAIDVPLLDAGDFREMQMDRRQANA